MDKQLYRRFKLYIFYDYDHNGCIIYHFLYTQCYFIMDRGIMAIILHLNDIKLDNVWYHDNFINFRNIINKLTYLLDKEQYEYYRLYSS